MGGQKCFEFNWFWNYTFELHCMWSDTWCMNCIAYEGIDMNSIWKETYMNCLACGGIRLTCTADGTIDWNCKRSDKFELHYIGTHTWIALQMRKYVCKRNLATKHISSKKIQHCQLWLLLLGIVSRRSLRVYDFRVMVPIALWNYFPKMAKPEL